jgi:hypothetical protein
MKSNKEIEDSLTEVLKDLPEGYGCSFISYEHPTIMKCARRLGIKLKRIQGIYFRIKKERKMKK